MLFQYNSCEDKDIYGMVKNCNNRRDTISLIYLGSDERSEFLRLGRCEVNLVVNQIDTNFTNIIVRNRVISTCIYKLFT